jgi:hypothetical protein
MNLDDAKPKQRPLILDPIVIASFGDFHTALKAQLSYLCKDSGCTSQSTQKSSPVGSQTETSSVNQSCYNTCSSSVGSGK